MEIYNSKYLQILFKEKNSLMVLNWKPATSKAKDHEFKKWNQDLVEKVNRHKPRLMLADTKKYLFTITPQLQEWSVINVFEPFAKAGLQKLALIISEEMFAQVSLEQFVDEYKGGKIQSKYFENIESARNWLFGS